MAEPIEHTALAKLIKEGRVHGAQVVGQAGGWFLRVNQGQGERVLMAQRSRRVRVFRRMETVISYLKAVGIEQFDVDAAAYEAGGDDRSRPDRAEAMRRTHEVAAHDTWFREQVEAALVDADSPNAEWVPHETVKRDMARQRVDLLARIKAAS